MNNKKQQDLSIALKKNLQKRKIQQKTRGISKAKNNKEKQATNITENNK